MANSANLELAHHVALYVAYEKLRHEDDDSNDSYTYRSVCTSSSSSAARLPRYGRTAM